MRNKKIMVMILLFCLTATTLAGCTESETDTTLKINIAVVDDSINEIQGNIASSMNNQDMASFQYWCEKLKTATLAGTNMIKSLTVSPGLLQLKTGYLEYLDDLYTAGKYGAQGDADKYLLFYENAVKHKLEINKG